MRLLLILLGLVNNSWLFEPSTPDIVFEQILFTDTTSTDNLLPVDKFELIKWKYNEEYFRHFDFKTLGGQFKARVIKVTGDDYSALVLLTFDKDDNIIDDYELAGGDCGGPTELEDKIEFCPRRKSIMVSENEFIVRQIQEYTTDTVNWVATERDSTEWRIFIDDKGKIRKRD